MLIMKTAVILLLSVSTFSAWPLETKLLGTNTYTQAASGSEPLQRLPRDVSIDEYHITIKPYFPFPGFKIPEGRDKTFDGTVKIFFEAVNEVKTIILNSYRLKLESIFFQDLTLKRKLSIDGVHFDEDANVLNVTSVVPLKEGHKYVLIIKYNGPINEYGDAGLYHSTYHALNEDGTLSLRTNIATFFEPMRARKMVPLFDDPFFKAVFKLTLIYPKGATVFGNTDQISSSKKRVDQYSEQISFEPTPRMSSYLLAFAVGDYYWSNAETKNKIPVSSISVPELKDYLQQSADIGAKCVDAMEGLTRVNYTLKKLDNIEMLHMGHSGAMENWGLIVYTRALAVHPKAPSRGKYYQKLIMCHEIGHQWFGDLVTADYWGQEFLHESFAAFFQYRATEEFDGEENKGTSYLFATQARVLALNNAEHGEHPVVADKAFFDGITYAAGGAMLRQTEAVLGHDVFYGGLNSYLNNKQFGSARHTDLFSALQTANENKAVCGETSVSQYLESFFVQRFHPLIDITWDKEEGYHFRQSSSDSKEDPTSWNVPIFYKELKSDGTLGPRKVIWSLKNKHICAAEELSPEKLFLFNFEGRTFARVQLSEEIWKKYFDFGLEKFDEYTLSALIHDYIYYLKLTGVNVSDFYIRILQEITKKSQKIGPLIGVEVVNAYKYLKEKLQDSHEYDLFKAHMGTLLTDIYQSSYWTDESIYTGVISRPLLKQLVVEDLSDARIQGQHYFEDFKKSCSSLKDLDNCNKLPGDIRPAVYCAAVIDGDQENIDFLKKYSEKHNYFKDTLFYFEYEIADIAEGLACAKKSAVEVIDHYVSMNSTAFFSSLKESTEGFQLVKDYLKANLPKFSDKKPLLKAALLVLTEKATKENVKELEDLNKAIEGTVEIRDQIALSQLIEDINEAKPDQKAKIEIVKYLYDKFVPVGKKVWSKRIPTYDLDLHYSLHLDTKHVLDEIPYYEANQKITFFAHSEINETITFASHRHLIKSVRVYVGGKVSEGTFTRDYDNGLFHLTISENVKLYDFVYIDINYIGYVFTNQNHGFFLTEYDGPSYHNNTYFLSTAFATGPGVRSFAPCFDEPSYKGIWTLSITHPAHLVALFNGVQQQTDYQKDGYTTTMFNGTPKTAPYLLALTVGPYASIQQVTSDEITVKVWAEIGQEQYGGLALESAVNALEYLREYNKYSYRNVNWKLDIVNTPRYPYPMENYGLIMLAPETGLYRSTVNTYKDKQNTYFIIAHETTHQWFGNAVTMKYFNNAFLHEGFATYFGAKIMEENLKVENYHDSLTTDRAFLLDEQHLDSLPVSINEDDVTDDVNWFHPAVYHKAYFAIKTVRNVFGEENFKEGLRQYFKIYSNKNADENDLWSIFQRIATAKKINGWNDKTLDVSQLVGPFTKQLSYPVITLKEEERNGVLTYDRQQSFLDPSKLPKSNFGYKWNVPLITENTTIDWSTQDSVLDDYSSVNEHRQSYARVVYDVTVSKLLDIYSNVDGYGKSVILSDYFTVTNFNLIEDITWEQTLSLLKGLQDSKAPLLWQRGYDIFRNLYKRAKVQEESHKYTIDFGKRLLNNRYALKHYKLKLTETELLWDTLALKVQFPYHKANAALYFRNYVNDCLESPESILECKVDGDVQINTIARGIRETKDPEQILNPFWKYILTLKRKHPNHPFVYKLADRLLTGVARSQHEPTIKWYLQSVIFSEYDKRFASFFEQISDNDVNQNILHDYLNEKVNEVQSSGYLEDYVLAMTSDWAREDERDTFKKLKEKLTKLDENVYNKVLANIQENIDWNNKNIEKVVKYFKESTRSENSL